MQKSRRERYATRGDMVEQNRQKSEPCEFGFAHFGGPKWTH